MNAIELIEAAEAYSSSQAVIAKPLRDGFFNVMKARVKGASTSSFSASVTISSLNVREEIVASVFVRYEEPLGFILAKGAFLGQPPPPQIDDHDGHNNDPNRKCIRKRKNNKNQSENSDSDSESIEANSNLLSQLQITPPSIANTSPNPIYLFHQYPPPVPLQHAQKNFNEVTHSLVLLANRARKIQALLNNKTN